MDFAKHMNDKLIKLKDILSGKYGVLLFVFFVYLALIMGYAKLHFGFNFSGFACIGDYFASEKFTDDKTHILKNSVGYDGQFYYFLAQDIFLTNGVEKNLDAPTYRSQRIMYPLLARILALGKNNLLKYTLVLVNFIAILIGTYIFVLLLEDNNISPWVSVYYPFLSGMLLCTLRDLAGPVAMMFLVVGLYYLIKQKHFSCSMMLGFSFLTKEINILILPCILFDTLLLKRNVKLSVILLLSLIPIVLWESYIIFVLKNLPFRGGVANFDIPFKAFCSYASEVFGGTFKTSEKVYVFFFLLGTGISFFLAIYRIFKKRDLFSIAFVMYALFAVCLSEKVWVEPWSYARVLLPFFVFLLFNHIFSKEKIFLLPIGINIILFFVTVWWLVNLHIV